MVRQLTRSEMSEIAAVKKNINRWRKTRKKLGPMPEELWDAALKLAKNYGFSKVAKELGVWYRTLRERMQVKKILPAEKPSFVEVSLCQDVSTVSECTIEMVRPDGATMTIHHPAHREVMTLAAGFWGQQ